MKKWIEKDEKSHGWLRGKSGDCWWIDAPHNKWHGTASIEILSSPDTNNKGLSLINRECRRKIEYLPRTFVPGRADTVNLPPHKLAYHLVGKSSRKFHNMSERSWWRAMSSGWNQNASLLLIFFGTSSLSSSFLLRKHSPITTNQSNIRGAKRLFIEGHYISFHKLFRLVA